MICDNALVSEQETASNLVPRALYEAAIEGAAEAIRVWATQRGVPLESIEDRGGALEYAGRGVYPFRFRTEDRYNGAVCVDGDGTVLAEDSRVSACRST